MPNKIWVTSIDGEAYRVEAKWTSWTGGGKLYVNGILTDTWKSNIGGGLTRFLSIGNKSTVLRATAVSFELDIDGKAV
jgi:hypothetical protein